MRVDRPPPGEELNEGAVSPARDAATMILLRDADDGPEVLLVRRNPEQRFMGGAWVFPGGATHEEDANPIATAVRELEEEAGISLEGDGGAVPFARWITPEGVKVRFDTWFFLARAPAGAQARPDGAECVDARWLRPRDALAAYSQGELQLVFPTIKQLERLADVGSVATALDEAAARPVEPVLPRVVRRADHAEVLLPGEPGYDAE